MIHIPRKIDLLESVHCQASTSVNVFCSLIAGFTVTEILYYLAPIFYLLAPGHPRL